MTSPPETWLPVADAARAAHLSVKAVRRRIERGSCVNERREGGRVFVLLSSLAEDRSPVPRPAGDAGISPPGIAEALARIEHLAAENGRLRALTEVAESTEKRLADELHQTRAELLEARSKLAAVEVASPRRWWRRSSSPAIA
jgi:ribosomal protein L29